MNLRTLSASLSLLFAGVNSTPFYEVKNTLFFGNRSMDMQAYDPESPFNSEFVKKGDLYTINEGLICFADSFKDFETNCFKNLTNNHWVRPPIYIFHSPIACSIRI